MRQNGLLLSHVGPFVGEQDALTIDFGLCAVTHHFRVKTVESYFGV